VSPKGALGGDGHFRYVNILCLLVMASATPDLLLPQLALVLIAPTHRGMARLS